MCAKLEYSNKTEIQLVNMVSNSYTAIMAIIYQLNKIPSSIKQKWTELEVYQALYEMAIMTMHITQLLTYDYVLAIIVDI